MLSLGRTIKNITLLNSLLELQHGMISFLSEAWGDRVSDQHIIRESGFLDLLEPTDLIMADRGFTIKEDLMVRWATLEIPPPSSGLEQMSDRDNVIATKKIALNTCGESYCPNESSLNFKENSTNYTCSSYR